jgi:hypothetical protein
LDKNNWIPTKQTTCYTILTQLKKKEVDLSDVCWSRQIGRPQQLCSDTEFLAACREMMKQNPGGIIIIITRDDVRAILKTGNEKNMAERGITGYAEKETVPCDRTVSRYYSLIAADLDAKLARKAAQQIMISNHASSVDSATAEGESFIRSHQRNLVTKQKSIDSIGFSI